MGMMKHRTKAAVWIVLILVLIFCLQPAAVRIVQAEETEVTAASLNPDFDTVIQKVHTYIKGEDTNPGYGSVWKVIGMTRSNLGVSSSYTDTFYKNVYTYLEQNDWNITRTTYSNYSKLILALTAAGKDAQNIGGHNLFAYLSDFSNVIFPILPFLKSSNIIFATFSSSTLPPETKAPLFLPIKFINSSVY